MSESGDHPTRRSAPDGGPGGQESKRESDQSAPTHGGMDDRDPPERDAPRSLLNRLRDASAARGTPRVAGVRKPGGQQRKRYSSEPISGGRDPEGVGTVFSRMLAERGWNEPVAIGSVLTRWREIVGADIAAHCVSESFDADTVLVRCDSTAWATQLRLVTPQVLQRFEAELGPGVVKKLSVVGPAAPSWRKGGRSVKGRGPRDTYG